MIYFLATCVAVAGLFFSPTQSHAAQSLQAVSGLKFPNQSSEGDAPVATIAWTIQGQPDSYPGFSELIPYFLRAPNQQDAGSCLYMSLTGIAEFWLSKLNPTVSRAPDGPLDLSERYLMNLAGLRDSQNANMNWRTDSGLLFNRVSGFPLNVGYRFTKGWVKTGSNGSYVKAAPNSAGAKYSTSYNWVNEMNFVSPMNMVKLPKFQREVLFADPTGDQWNVGVMPKDIVDKIKNALVTRKAPVNVIYNHYGYWHAVNIVGFDDAADTRNCTFVRGFMDSLKKKSADAAAQAARATNPAQKKILLAAAAKAERVNQKMIAGYSRGGGCHAKGMFYVRDSIYNDPTAPVYDYDPSRSGEEAHYTKQIVLHEYDWIQYMGNHATQVYVE